MHMKNFIVVLMSIGLALASIQNLINVRQNVELLSNFRIYYEEMGNNIQHMDQRWQELQVAYDREIILQSSERIEHVTDNKIDYVCVLSKQVSDFVYCASWPMNATNTSYWTTNYATSSLGCTAPGIDCYDYSL